MSSVILQPNIEPDFVPVEYQVVDIANMAVSNEGLIISDNASSLQALCTDPILTNCDAAVQHVSSPDLKGTTMTSDPTFVKLDLCEVFPLVSSDLCASFLPDDHPYAGNIDCDSSLCDDHPYAAAEQHTVAVKKNILKHSHVTRFVVKAVHYA